MASATLYVEGGTDQQFFCAFRKQFFSYPDEKPFAFEVQAVGGSRIFAQLKASVLSVVAAGSAASVRYAFVFDADASYDKTLEKICGVFNDDMASYGFKQLKIAGLPSNAMVFKSDSYEDALIGVWLMPADQQAGALESFIKQSIKDDKLLDHAINVVSELNPKRFVDAQQEKAELFTWMAWQEKPTRSYALVVDCLDENAIFVQNLITWLKNTFDVKTEKSS